MSGRYSWVRAKYAGEGPISDGIPQLRGGGGASEREMPPPPRMSRTYSDIGRDATRRMRRAQ